MDVDEEEADVFFGSAIGMGFTGSSWVGTPS